MTKQEIEEAVSALRNKHEPISHALALRIADALAALSPPTLEDVARDYEAVRKALAAGVMDERLVWDAPSPLARLCDGAARAQGLEETLATVATALCCAPHEVAEAAQQMRGGAVSSQEEIEALKRNLRNANLNTECTGDRMRAEKAEAIQWRDRAFTAESERDAARKERDELTARASQLAKEKATEWDRSNAMEKDRDALRERVATLERETIEALPVPKAAIAYAGHLPSFVRAVVEAHRNELADAYEEVSGTHLARAEAAERRVAELERQLAEEEGESERLENELVTATSRIEALESEESSTHPAPAGLLVAVGPLTQWARAVCVTYPPDYLDTPSDLRKDLLKPVLTLDFARALLAAYDATPEPTPYGCVGCARPMRHDTTQAADVCTGCGATDTGCACAPLANAPKPFVTHAQLAAVVEAYAKECEVERAAHEAESRDENDASSWLSSAYESKAEGAREVLERYRTAYDAAKGVEALENGPTGRDLVALREALAAILPGVRWAWSAVPALLRGIDGQRAENVEKAAKWDAAVERAKDAGPLNDLVHDAMTDPNSGGWPVVGPRIAAYVLRLDTPPSGPGGGERQDPPEYDATGAREAWCSDAQPEPAAPEVVWEAPGSVRVVGPVGQEYAEVKGRDGEWYEANVGGWVYVLARALAEAKRAESEALSSASVRREVLANASRKAAEDMRERAAVALLAKRDSLPTNISAKTSGIRGGLELGAAIVRALPVEAP